MQTPSFGARGVAIAGGNGHDVFDSAADFHTDDIVIGINPQTAAVKRLHQGIADMGMLAGSDQCSRQTRGHLLGKTRPAQRARMQMAGHLLLHFVRQQAMGRYICAEALSGLKSFA